MAPRMKAAQSLVFGEQIGWGPTDVIDKPAGPFLRECARARHRLQRYLVGGRLMAPLKLVGESPDATSDWKWGGGEWPVTTKALQTGAWRAADGGATAVIFANCGPQPVSVTWLVDSARLGGQAGARRGARWTRFDGPAQLGEGDQVKIVVPAESVISVELNG